METSYRCPDCGHQHDEPGEAILGFRVRCLDCLIEIELAFELRMTPPTPLAA